MSYCQMRMETGNLISLSTNFKESLASSPFLNHPLLAVTGQRERGWQGSGAASLLHAGGPGRARSHLGRSPARRHIQWLPGLPRLPGARGQHRDRDSEQPAGPASPASQATAGSSQTYSFPTACASRRGDVTGGAFNQVSPRARRSGPGPASSQRRETPRPALPGRRASAQGWCRVPMGFAGRRTPVATLHHLHTAPGARRSGVDGRGETHENKPHKFSPGLGAGRKGSYVALPQTLPSSSHLFTKTSTRLVTDTCCPPGAYGFSARVTGATLPWALAQSHFYPPPAAPPARPRPARHTKSGPRPLRPNQSEPRLCTARPRPAKARPRDPPFRPRLVGPTVGERPLPPSALSASLCWSNFFYSSYCFSLFGPRKPFTSHLLSLTSSDPSKLSSLPPTT